MIKLILFAILVLLPWAGVFFVVDVLAQPTPAVIRLTTTPSTITMEPGQKQELLVAETIRDESTKAGGSEVSWTSSDNTVADVVRSPLSPETSYVYAHKVGTAKIIGKLQDVTTSITVTVTEATP